MARAAAKLDLQMVLTPYGWGHYGLSLLGTDASINAFVAWLSNAGQKCNQHRH